MQYAAVTLGASRSLSVHHHKSGVIRNIVTAVNLKSTKGSLEINLAWYLVLHLQPVHDHLADTVAVTDLTESSEIDCHGACLVI